MATPLKLTGAAKHEAKGQIRRELVSAHTHERLALIEAPFKGFRAQHIIRAFEEAGHGPFDLCGCRVELDSSDCEGEPGHIRFFLRVLST